METIKSYTDISQSKKLAEFLPLESADMCFNTYNKNMPPLMIPYSRFNEYFNMEPVHAFLIPCWSLASLLGVLPKYELYNFGDTIQLDVNLEAFATEGDETLLDLIVNMIIHLHELKML